MANKRITNCGDCAYVDKSDDRHWWCPFHDEPCSPRLVCDDFLDEYQTPQWQVLSAGMNNKRIRVEQYTSYDIRIYIASGLMWCFGVIGCLMFLFIPL